MGKYRNPGKNARIIPLRRGVVHVAPGGQAELPDAEVADMARLGKIELIPEPVAEPAQVLAPEVEEKPAQPEPVAEPEVKLSRKQRRQAGAL